MFHTAKRRSKKRVSASRLTKRRISEYRTPVGLKRLYELGAVKCIDKTNNRGHGDSVPDFSDTWGIDLHTFSIDCFDCKTFIRRKELGTKRSR